MNVSLFDTKGERGAIKCAVVSFDNHTKQDKFWDRSGFTPNGLKILNNTIEHKHRSVYYHDKITIQTTEPIDLYSLQKGQIQGLELARLDFSSFCSTVIFEYYKPFVNAVFRSFDIVQRQNDTYNLKSISNSEISQIIHSFYDKDIYYLTESNGRYMSSWLNSLRDDVGCITFKPKQQTKEIIINYNPIYSKEYTAKFIKENVKIDYLNNYLNDY